MHKVPTIYSLYLELKREITLTEWVPSPLNLPERKNMGPLNFHIQKCTSRQRSGKGAIRKRFPFQKPRWEKTKLTIRYLYHENIL